VRNPKQKRSRRFDSIKSAISFCKKVEGEFMDLRSQVKRKSNFKVTYIKEIAHKLMNNDF